jgi:adenylosuccinate lyase
LSYGTFASQKVEMLLKSKGMPAELAYRKVQYYSAAAVQSRESLLKVLKADVDVAARVAPHELDDCFDLKKWVAAEDVLYGRMK